jgi:hypothetical protein
VEAKKKHTERNARFLETSLEPSEVIHICCQLNYENKVFYKTPFIDWMRSVRYFLVSNGKLKKRRIGYSKTIEDMVNNFNDFFTIIFIIACISSLHR